MSLHGGEGMKFANVRELKNKTSEILRKAEKAGDYHIKRQAKGYSNCYHRGGF